MDMEEKMTEKTPEKQEENLLSAQQKLLESVKEREEKILEKEEKLKREERKNKALQLLREKNLPLSFGEALSLLSEEDMLEGIEEMETLFREEVKKAVEERLKESVPPSGVMQDMNALPDQEFYAAKYPHLV